MNRLEKRAALEKIALAAKAVLFKRGICKIADNTGTLRLPSTSPNPQARSMPSFGGTRPMEQARSMAGGQTHFNRAQREASARYTNKTNAELANINALIQRDPEGANTGVVQQQPQVQVQNAVQQPQNQQVGMQYWDPPAERVHRVNPPQSPNQSAATGNQQYTIFVPEQGSDGMHLIPVHSKVIQ